MTGIRFLLLITVVCLAYIIWGICGSLLPPFFPDEAKSKGATLSQSGLVFGIFSLAGFISSPLFGKYGSTMSPRYLYIPSAFIIAGCTLAFGALHFVKTLNLFLSLSYILRILSGMANAAAWGSLLAALITIFPDKVAKIVAASEFCYGIGYMLGPAVGGFFYKLGGFVLPFEIIGSIALIVSISMVIVIPKVNASPSEDSNESEFGSMKLMKLPGVLLSLLDTFFTSFGLGMIEGMMGLHLQSMGATINIVSIGFFVLGGCYMISTVVSGLIADKVSTPTLFSIAGNVGQVLAFLLIGPLPFFPIEPNVPLSFIGLALFGFSMGLMYVSSFTRAEKSATDNGFPDNTKTYQLISGLWVASDLSGNFLGPSIGGIVVETLGFRMTTLLFWIPYLFMLSADIIELCNFKKRHRSNIHVQYTQINTFD